MKKKVNKNSIKLRSKRRQKPPQIAPREAGKLRKAKKLDPRKENFIKSYASNDGNFGGVSLYHSEPYSNKPPGFREITPVDEKRKPNKFSKNVKFGKKNILVRSKNTGRGRSAYFSPPVYLHSEVKEKKKFDLLNKGGKNMADIEFDVSDLDLGVTKKKNNFLEKKPGFRTGVPKYSVKVSYPTVKDEVEYSFNVLDGLLDFADDDIFAPRNWERPTVKIGPTNPKVRKSPYPYFEPFTYKLVKKEPEIKKEKIYKIMRFKANKLFTSDKDTYGGRAKSIALDKGDLVVKKRRKFKNKFKMKKKKKEDTRQKMEKEVNMVEGILDGLDIKGDDIAKESTFGLAMKVERKKESMLGGKEKPKKKKRWKKRKDALSFWKRDIEDLERIGGIYDGLDDDSLLSSEGY